MSSFIEKSFCKGVVPAGVPAFNYDRREQLVKMLGTNELVRVVMAPSGYGKSALCASFANTKQGFRKTAWVDCMSPCFIRDLCNGEIAKRFGSALDELSLCVFDELPCLNDDEQKNFLKLIEQLTLDNVSVAINSSPETKNDFLRNNFNFFIEPIEMLCEKENTNSIPALVYSHGLNAQFLIR